MAHAIETMAFTNEVPWHGLGNKVDQAPDVDSMLKLAGLDWSVSLRPSFVGQLTDPSDDKSAIRYDLDRNNHYLVRDMDQKILSKVGSQYKPIQNKDAFKFFKEFVEAGSAKMETAGSLLGGKMVWGLASLQQSFKLKGDDEVKGYVLVASPHELGKSFIVKLTTVRVVCNNTLTMALNSRGKNEFRMSHSTKFDDFMVERAKETIGVARDQMTQFEKDANILRNINMNWDDCVKILAPVYQPANEVKDIINDWDDTATKTMKELKEAMYRAPGAIPDNAWGLLNAVTYHADHIAGTDAKRLHNAWVGYTANRKQQVMEKLLQLA